MRDAVRRIEALAADHEIGETAGPENAPATNPRPWFAGAAIIFGQCAISGIFLVALFDRLVTGAEIGETTGIAGFSVGVLIFAFLNPTPFFKKAGKMSHPGLSSL